MSSCERFTSHQFGIFRVKLNKAQPKLFIMIKACLTVHVSHTPDENLLLSGDEMNIIIDIELY